MRRRMAWVPALFLALAGVAAWWWLTRPAPPPAAAATPVAADQAHAGDGWPGRDGTLLGSQAAATTTDATPDWNAQAEARFVVDGALDGDAASAALQGNAFAAAVALLEASSRADPALAARNAALRGTLADALAAVDNEAVLQAFSCSSRLCAMELLVAPDREGIDYSTFIAEEVGAGTQGSFTAVERHESSGDRIAMRTLFSIGPGIRGIRTGGLR